MIGLPAGTRIWLAAGITDMRSGFNGAGVEGANSLGGRPVQRPRVCFSWPTRRPIERGIAGPGLLAHVLVAMYADHLPLYRQSVIYGREA